MRTRPLLMTAALLVASISAVFADSKPKALDPTKIQLAQYAKAFIGQGNVTVHVAPYQMGTKSGAILLFKGVESEWDGQAIDHEVLPGLRGGADYTTQVNGKDWTSLTARKDYEGKTRYELYVPGVSETISLAPSDGAAQLMTPKAIWDEYAAQNGKKGSSK